MRLTGRARATRRALLHLTLSVFAIVSVATLLLVAAATKPQASTPGAVVAPVALDGIDRPPAE